MEINQDNSCRTPRWKLLKDQLNNLNPQHFLKEMEGKNNAIIIDVRTPKEFEENHLEGAVNISYFDEELWNKICTLKQYEYFFIYCKTGRRSIRVCTLMKNGGFDIDKIFNLDGGITALTDNLKSKVNSKH